MIAHVVVLRSSPFSRKRITATFEGAVDPTSSSPTTQSPRRTTSPPIPTSAGEAAAKAPGIEAIASVRSGQARVFGSTEFVTATEPETGSVIEVDWEEGSQAVFGALGRDGAFVDDSYADDHHLRIGSPIPLLTPAGKTLHLVVKGSSTRRAGARRSATSHSRARPTTRTTSRRRTSSRSFRCAAT